MGQGPSERGGGLMDAPIFWSICRDHGFNPKHDRVRREFIAWWWSKGNLVA